jgi:peptidoglycan/LPS O-acetylase OafA/YrhL
MSPDEHMSVETPSATAGHARGVYRPDVDGLRAIAVLAVVAYHVKAKLLPGGFVGVDVFFVISGFLISGIILERLRAGRFSIADFYARRIRRIFPALGIVLAACLLVGWFLALPNEYLDLGGDVAAGAGFVSNLRFWTQTSYFGPDVTTKALLHLWSLGIEEQYYLVWPLLLILLWRTQRRVVPIIALLVGSFALNVVYSFTDARAAFYSPACRLWELLLGSLVAYVALAHGDPIALLTRRVQRRPERVAGTELALRQAAAWTGILMIAAAMILLRGTSVFPGFWALLPTLGTALLICSGPGAWVNRVVLSDRTLVGVGLISYPLYLWHWPVLTLIRLQFPDASYAMKGVAMLGAFVAAYATYRVVETPIRRRGGRRAVSLLLASQAMLLVAGLVLVRAQGFPNRGDPIRRRIFAVSLGATRMNESYAEGSCFLRITQRAADFPASCYRPATPDSGGRKVLLWGDSFAAQYVPGMRQVRGDGTSLFQLTSSLCAPIVHYTETRRPRCAAINRFIMARIRETKPDVVVLAGRWIAYPQFADVERTILELKQLGIAHVVLVGSSTQYGDYVPRLLLQRLSSGPVPTRLQPPVIGKLRQIDSVLRAVAARSGGEFVAPLDAECDGTWCLVALDTAAIGITTWDDGHLTATGSRYVVERTLRRYLTP